MLPRSSPQHAPLSSRGPAGRSGYGLLRREAAQIGDDRVEVVAVDVLVVAVGHGRPEALAAGTYARCDRRLDVAVQPGAEIRRRDVARERGAPGTVEVHAAGAKVVHEVRCAVGARRRMALDAVTERAGKIRTVSNLV